MRVLLPRFCFAVVGVPLAFAMSIFAVKIAGIDGAESVAAAFAAITFAAVLLAPSHTNAAIRLGTLLAFVGVGFAGAVIWGSP